MSKNNENKLVPKLRFPEFENSDEWEETTLGKITNITNGKSNAQDHIENGKYPLFDRSAIIKASNNFLFDCEAVIIPGEGMKFIPKYYKGKFDLHQRSYALKDFTVEVEGIFVYYSMMHRSDLLAKKAVKSTVLSLRLPILQNFPIQIPKVLNEQQKIAACLSSLDDLIKAESQKLELLKEHKKGLLQNLFPQEGETVPKLRFKEFEGKEEWSYFNGDKLFEPIVNKNHNSDLPILAITQEQGAVPRDMIDYHVFVTDKSIASYKVVEVGDFIISLRSFQGGIEYSNYKGLCSPAYIILRKKGDLENDFYRHYFKSVHFIRDLNKNLEGIRDGKIISYKQFSEILIPKPKREEQQKIASCLSSLDDLINAQCQKIEALKLHKKGLLQGLFPNINDDYDG
jgi:type I restriction enzyme S subunit